MKEKEIKVLKVTTLQVPEVITLKNTLEDLQKAVSIDAPYVGLIEIVEIDSDTCILCNEEGKLIGLEPNRRFGNDILCGVFYVTGQDKCGNLTSLSDEAIEKYKERFKHAEIILRDEVEDTILTGFYIE